MNVRPIFRFQFGLPTCRSKGVCGWVSGWVISATLKGYARVCQKGSDRDDSENVAISIDENISHVGEFSNV